MSAASATRPLAGIRVVVTRATRQAASLVAALGDAGADVASLPLLEIVPPADPAPLHDALTRIATFDWLAFSSANSVANTAAEMPRGLLRTARAARRPRIATIGPATARAVRELGGHVDVEAQPRDGRGLARAIIEASPSGDERVFLPQAADARPGVADALRRAGLAVEVAVAYDKQLPTGASSQATELFATTPLGWVTFASPRTVAHFVTVLDDAWPARRSELRAAAIGPTTAEALHHIGVEAAVAAAPTPAMMVAAIVAAVLNSEG